MARKLVQIIFEDKIADVSFRDNKVTIALEERVTSPTPPLVTNIPVSEFKYNPEKLGFIFTGDGYSIAPISTYLKVASKFIELMEKKTGRSLESWVNDKNIRKEIKNHKHIFGRSKMITDAMITGHGFGGRYTVEVHLPDNDNPKLMCARTVALTHEMSHSILAYLGYSEKIWVDMVHKAQDSFARYQLHDQVKIDDKWYCVIKIDI